MNVLFCTDGSETSLNSIINFSKWKSNIIADILCVADWNFLPETISIEDSQFALKCANSTDTVLNYAEEILEENSILIGKKIKMCGGVVDCILETCENNLYSFVILGSNGKKGIQKWIGSVSQELANVSKVPVFISKSRKTSKNILFAVDNSDDTKKVVKFALENLDLTDKTIHLATVYEMPDFLFLEGSIDNDWINEINQKQKKYSLLLLSEFENLISSYNLHVKTSNVLKGNPSEAIIGYIRANNIDLVVCGVRNRKFISKMLLSSVGKRILEATPSDVLIINPNTVQS